jgi:hypothetical protein
MRRRPTPAANLPRDLGHELAERRALKLMRIGVGTPTDERRWARAARLPVAELRARAKAAP